jgi:hypothetical protein
MGAVGGNGVGNSQYPNPGAGLGGAGLSTYSQFLIDADAGVDISGTHWIAGGGGGAAPNAGVATGGNGGGGNGGVRGTGATYPTAGTANTGGGGGGNAYGGADTAPLDGADGGSGIVILRWTTADFGICSVTGTGNAITTSGSDSIAKFIIDGTITFTPPSNASFLLNFV